MRKPRGRRLPGKTLTHAELMRKVTEKQTQASCVQLLRTLGFFVNVLSQPRETMQTPGIPDLYAQHMARGIAFWWETKRPVGGKYSPEQLAFRDRCAASGTLWGGGDLTALRKFLVGLGLLKE